MVFLIHHRATMLVHLAFEFFFAASFALFAFWSVHSNFRFSVHAIDLTIFDRSHRPLMPMGSTIFLSHYCRALTILNLMHHGESLGRPPIELLIFIWIFNDYILRHLRMLTRLQLMYLIKWNIQLIVEPLEHFQIAADEGFVRVLQQLPFAEYFIS